mgnify:CR=1 FL=1
MVSGRLVERGNVTATVRAIVACLALLAWPLAGAATASAHTSLATSDPAVLNSAGGRNWIEGAAKVYGPRLTAAVRSDIPGNGLYTVGYRVVSADGHPVSGSYTFTIADGPSATPTPAPAATPQSSESPGPDTRSSIITAGLAGLALGGLIALWQALRRRRNRILSERDD